LTDRLYSNISVPLPFKLAENRIRKTTIGLLVKKAVFQQIHNIFAHILLNEIK